MKKILLCFYLTKTIPLNKYRIYEIGQHSNYFELNNFQETLNQLSTDCYLKLNTVLKDNLNQFSKEFKINIYISNSTLNLFEKYLPNVLESFKELSKFNSVEFLIGSNSFHLDDDISQKSFSKKINSHNNKIKELFNVIPSGIKLSIFSPKLIDSIQNIKSRNILISRNLISKNFSDELEKNNNFNLIVPNEKISNIINIDFSNKSSSFWPYNSKKLVEDLLKSEKEIIILDLNYESFGITHKEEDGIYNFIKLIPQKIIENEELEFINFSQLDECISNQNVSQNKTISLVDNINNMNNLQKDAYNQLLNLEKHIETINDESITNDWERLNSIEYFKNMHPDFFDKTRYDSHYDAYINFMNALTDLKERINKARLPSAGIKLNTENESSNFDELKHLITNH